MSEHLRTEPCAMLGMLGILGMFGSLFMLDRLTAFEFWLGLLLSRPLD